MNDYSKKAAEHALTAVTVEAEREVEKIVQNDFTAYYELAADLSFRSRNFRMGIDKNMTPANPWIRENLAAIVLTAAAMIYEYDKRLSGS
jgi:hypothetical protein